MNLTTKELTALEDQIGQEQTLVKKYQAMAQISSDTTIKKSLTKFAKQHQQHCDTLISYLN